MYRIISCILVLAAFVSCKKETEHAPYPYNSIEKLSIAAGGDDKINASFHNDSIIVYWPSYLPKPAKITPEIIVSEKATVTPASGAEVAFTTGTKFTVKAQNGAVKDYFLKVIVNQPDIQVFESTYATTKGGTITVNNGQQIRYLARDVNLTRFYILDNASKETQIPIEFADQADGSPIMRIKVPNTDDIKIGAYKIKIVSEERTFISPNAIFGVLYPASAKPIVKEVTAPITVKQGETITFNGTGFFDMKEARVYAYDANWNEIEVATLALVSSTATTATYRIPATFKAGTYQLGGYDADGIGIQLRITDFIGFWNWSKQTKVYVNVDGATSFTVTP
jgi:hypothetical protein